MGGAERTARKRRQEQLLAQQQRRASTTASSGGGDRTRKLVAGGAVLALIAALVVGGVLWMDSRKNATEGAVIPPVNDTAEVTEKRDGMVVVTGAEDAKATIDVYADFLCPACGQFEAANAPRIAKAVEAGDLRVRTHMLPFLNGLSDPPGYSRDAANAALCAADEGRFTAFHDSLFAAQPPEGARGYDKRQLTRLGKDLGITAPGFATCVRQGSHDKGLDAELTAIKADPKLKQNLGDGPIFYTPMVVADGKIIDWSKETWLADALNPADG